MGIWRAGRSRGRKAGSMNRQLGGMGSSGGKIVKKGGVRVADNVECVLVGFLLLYYRCACC